MGHFCVRAVLGQQDRANDLQCGMSGSYQPLLRCKVQMGDSEGVMVNCLIAPLHTPPS